MYFHVGEIAVVEDDVVLVKYFLGNEFFVDAHILEVLHGSYQIEVLDVDEHVSCVVFCAQDGAVDVNLHVEEGDCWGTWFARIIEFVAACCKAYAMCL